MSGKKPAKTSIPKFKSREEEAAFWDTHSFADFEAETTPVEVQTAKPLGRTGPRAKSLSKKPAASK